MANESIRGIFVDSNVISWSSWGKASMGNSEFQNIVCSVLQTEIQPTGRVLREIRRCSNQVEVGVNICNRYEFELPKPEVSVM